MHNLIEETKMRLNQIDEFNVTVLVDNVMDIISTAPKSVTGHVRAFGRPQKLAIA